MKIKTHEVDRKAFYLTVGSIKYRDQDQEEARYFGCLNVKDCYDKAKHEFARYFTLTDEGEPVVTVMLQRDGQIIFFISDRIKHKVALVRALRRLAKKTVKCCGPITTKTANWYEEALKFNKLIGFKLYRINNRYQVWTFGYEPLEKF